MQLPQRWASLGREALFPADTDGRDRFAFLMLLAFILVAPWLGSARLPALLNGLLTPVGRLLVPAFGFAIGAAAFSSRSSFRSLRPLAVPLGSLLGIALLGALQLAPLPDRAFGLVAPVNLEIYHETAEILSLYGKTPPLPRVSLAPEETAGSVLRLGGYAVLLAAAAQLLRTRPRRRVFVGTLLTAACLHVVAAGVVLAGGGPFRGAFGSAEDFGDYLLVILPLAFGAFWAAILTNSDRGRDAVDRAERLEQQLSPVVARGLAFATLMAGIALTGSGGNVAAGTVAIGFLLALASRRRRRKRPAGAVATGVTASLLLAARVNAVPLAALELGGDMGRRLAVWRASLDAWHRFPILGTGLGAFRDAFRRVQPRELSGFVDTAQSDLLQILVTGGAVGALAAVVACASLLAVLLRLWKEQKHREESAMALAGVGALAALGLDGLVEFNLGAPAVPATLACVLGLAVAAGLGSPREPSAAPQTP
ncbi:MAG: O-antigen ligase family protein [Thermoanaerobaculia bacterium]